MSTKLKPFVSKLYIDSSRAMGVARPVWQRGNYRLIHSDHYPCLLPLKEMPWAKKTVIKEKKEKRVQWNLKKEGGWNRYELLSDECTEALDKAIEDEGKDVEEIMSISEKVHEKVKFRSFSKVNIPKRKEVREEPEKGRAVMKKRLKIF